MIRPNACRHFKLLCTLVLRPKFILISSCYLYLLWSHPYSSHCWCAIFSNLHCCRNSFTIRSVYLHDGWAQSGSVGNSHDDHHKLCGLSISTSICLHVYLYLVLYPAKTPLFNSGPDSLSLVSYMNMRRNCRKYSSRSGSSPPTNPATLA